LLQEFLIKNVAPSVEIAEATFLRGKTVAGMSTHKRKRDSTDSPKPSPCGFSLNWQMHDRNDNVELLVGARGLRQGKKPKSEEDYVRQSSGLSRRSFVQSAVTWGLHHSEPQGTSYKVWKEKQACVVYQEVRQRLFEQGGPLSGWLVGNDNDFVIDSDSLKAKTSNL
jgi:hypothetical protein